MSSGVTYRVRVSWAGRNTGVFVLDRAPGFDSQTLGQYANTVGFGGSYDDVTADTTDLAIKIGHDRLQDQVFAGSLDLTFLDKGKYNPYNAASPIYGQLLPMRPVMVDCSLDGGATYPYIIFQGWSRTGTSNPDYGTQQATLHAEDIYLWLSRTYPVITEMGVTTIGAALLAILSNAGWQDPSFLAIDTGDTIAHFTADGTVDGLTLINNLMDIAQGLFFFSPQGVATFLDRNHWIKNTSLGTIQLAQSTLPGYDLDSVINSASLTATNGITQTYTDGASKATYGESDYAGLGDASYLCNDAHALALGNYIVVWNKAPSSKVWNVVVSEGPSGYLPIMLSASLKNRVTLATPALTGDYLIESIQHKGSAGNLHSTTWGMSLVPTGSAVPFILDNAPGFDARGLPY